MSMIKTVNETLKTTVKKGSTLLEIDDFEELSEYLEKTYVCSINQTLDTFHLFFYSNSGDLFSVQNMSYDSYAVLVLRETKPKDGSKMIVEFKLLLDKDGELYEKTAHDEFLQRNKPDKQFSNDTGTYSYREFCGDCGMCIKTVLVCPICGGRS